MNLERGLRPEGSDSEGSATFGRRRSAPIGAGWGHLTAAGCVEGGGKRVQKVQKVQRVQRVVDCPVGNAYKVSVTGLAFASPVPLGKR
jgi:hypothetical protein